MAVVDLLFRNKGIRVNEKWLSDCLMWAKLNDVLESALPQVVWDRWLTTDLRECGVSCLPPGVDMSSTGSTHCINLTEPLTLQIIWIRDISRPAYKQLMKLKGQELPDEENIIRHQKQGYNSDSPTASRVLYCELTDGSSSLHALECRPLGPHLHEDLPSGTKVQLRGPLKCRSRTLLLDTPTSFVVLGGEVESLVLANSKIKTLTKALGNRSTLGDHTSSVVHCLPVVQASTPLFSVMEMGQNITGPQRANQPLDTTAEPAPQLDTRPPSSETDRHPLDITTGDQHANIRHQQASVHTGEEYLGTSTPSHNTLHQQPATSTNIDKELFNAYDCGDSSTDRFGETGDSSSPYPTVSLNSRVTDTIGPYGASLPHPTNHLSSRPSSHNRYDRTYYSSRPSGRGRTRGLFNFRAQRPFRPRGHTHMHRPRRGYFSGPHFLPRVPQ